jgi:PTS system mannose-specific IIB component
MLMLVRIDDRLIHGQVVEGWVNFLKATCILVADDAVAASPAQRSIMELAVPEGIKVVVGGVADICARLGSSALAKDRVILLFSNPADVLRSLDLGLQCPVVNLGGLHFMPGRRRILDVLAVDDAERSALQEIMRRGVKVEIQTIPSERPQPLGKVLGEAVREQGPHP